LHFTQDCGQINEPFWRYFDRSFTALQVASNRSGAVQKYAQTPASLPVNNEKLNIFGLRIDWFFTFLQY
jgi:hypothetical protein